MKNFGSLPSFSDLRNARFEQFCEITGYFLDKIEPEEALAAIEYKDLIQAESHPNGFFIIRLSDPCRKNEGQTRIHLWQADPKLDRDNGEIHKHPWHLASKVLLGKYVERIADVHRAYSREDANYTSIRMERDSHTGHNHYLDPELVKVSLLDSEVYPEGSTHYLPETDYHHTPISSDELVVTLPIMGRVLSPERRFLEALGNISHPVANPHTKASTSDVATLWEQIKQARR